VALLESAFCAFPEPTNKNIKMIKINLTVLLKTNFSAVLLPVIRTQNPPVSNSNLNITRPLSDHDNSFQSLT
jgi:hypothetical protein